MSNSIDNFIPSVWGARILRTLEEKYVYAALTNRDYEGDIRSYGDTVKINSIGDITVGDYVKYTTEVSPERLDGVQQELDIDQAKFFAFEVDDIDQAQSKPKVMDEAVRKSSRALAKAADTFIADLMDSEAGLTGPEGEELDAAAIPGFMGKVNQLLDEADNDEDEARWIVVPAWFKKLLVISFQDNTQSVDVQTNGRVGRYFGLNVYSSNRVPTAGDNSVIIAGTNRAVTMAEQIVKTEAYRPEKSFSDAVKGLHVYGAEAVLPNALVRCTAKEAS